jgi:tripartite ATP-independent transporter DctP family solute receptor
VITQSWRRRRSCRARRRGLTVAAITLLLGAAAPARAAEEKPREFVLYYADRPLFEVGQYRLMPHGWAAGVAFKQALEQRTRGQIRVRLYHSGSLGSHKDAVDQVATGVIQGFSAADGHFSEYFPPLQVINLPYAFRDPSVAWHVLDGPFGRHLVDAAVERTGVRILALWDNGGLRQLINGAREIRTPADARGLKFRSLPIRLHQRLFESWGASATAVPWVELYSALQTGVVDGMDSPPDNFLLARLYEVQSHMTLSGHLYSAAVLLGNEAWIQALPEELRAAVFDAGGVAAVAGRGAARVQQQLALEDLETKHGMQVYQPTVEELAQFEALAREPTRRWLATQIDPRWIDELERAVREAELSLGFR